jgi:hypothetical protein
MDRTVSSIMTFFLKFLLPPLWIGGFGIGILQNDVDLQVMLYWIVGSTFLLWSSVPLKRVVLRADGLSVSNYRREILIPFGAIERVTQNRWSGGRPVTIYLRSETPFGRRIRFMPAGWRLALWQEDEVVKEIRWWASRAKTISKGN